MVIPSATLQYLAAALRLLEFSCTISLIQPYQGISDQIAGPCNGAVAPIRYPAKIFESEPTNTLIFVPSTASM